MRLGDKEDKKKRSLCTMARYARTCISVMK